MSHNPQSEMLGSMVRFNSRPMRATAMAVVLSMIVAVVSVGGAVALGLRWPSIWSQRGPDDNVAFDYGAPGRSLGPLSSDYIRSRLGIDGSLEPAATDTSAAGSHPTGRRGAGLAGPAPVIHRFTNNDFDDAYNVHELPFSGRTNATAATRQPGEPSDCLVAGGTAWYRYRSQADAGLFADTFGSAGPTSLAVYTGNDLRNLSSKGCDLNTLGNAQLGFLASAGTTYYFQVTGPLDRQETVFELAAVGATTVETLSPTGGRPDAPAGLHPDVSADGRWVVFVSWARNLTATPPDCNFPVCDSLYLRDRITGTTALVATNMNGNAPGYFGWIAHPTVSTDGRYVGFSFSEFPGDWGFEGSDEVDPNAYGAFLFDRATGEFEMVGRNSAGEAARSEPGRDGYTVPSVPLNGTMAPSLSADGRYVVFTSDGANLGGHVEPGRAWNVYRRDRVTGETRLVSVDAQGQPMSANSFACTGRNLSGDGRYVFFSSTFGTGQDSHDVLHLYLWDAVTGRTLQVTRLPDAGQTQGSYCPSISQDGSRTAFVSRDALVPEDTNDTPDVYAYEVSTGHMQRVSVTSAGEQTTDANYEGTEGSAILPRSVSLSADGRYVAFDSAAPDLVPSWVGSTRRVGAGSPGPIQVYVHDVVTRATVLASVSSTGEPLAGNNVMPYLSPDGSVVSFMSSGLWTASNSVKELDVMVHSLR